jgi:hypothetical protein
MALLYFILELYALSALGVSLDNRHESSVFEGLKLGPPPKKSSGDAVFETNPVSKIVFLR